MFGLFFGVVLVANLVFAVVANRSWTGLVVPNSYVASQQYNDVLRVAAEQDARGWRGGVQASSDRLVFTLLDRDGSAVRLASAVIRLERPIGTGNDWTGPLVVDGNRAVLQPGPARGAWNVRVDAVTREGVGFRLDQRILIRAGR